MLAALLFAFQVVAVEPAPEPARLQAPELTAFCANLETALTAAEETPAFASLSEKPEEQTLDAFGYCGRTYEEGAPALTCIRPAWTALADSVAGTVEIAEACIGQKPIPAPGGLDVDRAILFETPAWSLRIEPQGCDRCAGMPQVRLWLRAGPPLRASEDAAAGRSRSR